MDEKLTKIWKDENMRWRIIFIVISTLLSAVFAYLTQKIVLTIIFIIATACIDILVESYKYIKFVFGIKRIVGLKKKNRYILFVGFAIFPTLCGLVELVRSNQINDRNLFLNLCNNFISNILGALIVCSIINHIKKFNYEQIIENFIVSRKNVYNTFLKVAVFACFVNAVNFDLKNEPLIMNIVNKVYLNFIIFYGMCFFYTFALRIIDKTPFSFSIKEIYPTGVLVWGGGFLISCNISAFFGVEKSSYPILLLINTITAFVVAIGILILLSKRTENTSDFYPWKRLMPFVIAIGANCYFGFKFCDDIGSIVEQFISGGAIFLVSLALILYLAWKQFKNEKKERRKYCIIVIDEENSIGEKDILEKISIHNKDIAIFSFYSVEELIEWESNNNIGLVENIADNTDEKYINAKI